MDCGGILTDTRDTIHFNSNFQFLILFLNTIFMDFDNSKAEGKTVQWIESKLLPSKYIFNEEMIKSIDIEEIMEGEFHIQIIGKDDEVIDLEIGEETSNFMDIPPELISQI